MFLGVLSKDGPIDPTAHNHAVNEFSLGGSRPVSVHVNNALLLATTNGPPHPPLTMDADGRRLACASGDAYDLETSSHQPAPSPGFSPLADVLLDSYHRDGSNLTPPRNGCFTFVAYDATANELVLGNDAFGFHPLFMLETPQLVAFCNEFEPLTRLLPGGPQLDRDAVAQFFVFGSTLGSRTLIEGIMNLDPATILAVRNGKITRRRHDSLEIPIARGLSLEQAAEKVGAAFRGAVQRRLGRYPEPIATLTGGADTRLILSCMSPEQRRRVRFVTHYIEKGAADKDRDVVIARRLAEKTGIQHEAHFIEEARAPFAPEVFRRQREREPRPEELHGVWGGEFLGGCAVDVALFPVERITREAVQRKAKRLLSPEMLKSISDPYDALQTEYGRICAQNREFLFWIGMFTRPFFTHLYSGSAGLSTSTWMTPWTMSLRLTCPFQDGEFLRTLLSVPFELVTGYRLYNAVYAICFPELTDIPTNSGLAVRSDSVLTMYVRGEEPKKRRLKPSEEARRAAYLALDADGEIWRRGILARDAARSQCGAETTDREKPSLTKILKNRYTSSILFRARRYLPLHKMLMRWKKNYEAASAAQLQSELVGALVDFEYWCRYAGIQPNAQVPDRTCPREDSPLGKP